MAEIESKSDLLHVRKQQLTQPDFYGTVDFTKWSKEMLLFVNTRIVPRLQHAALAGNIERLLPRIYQEIEHAANRPIRSDGQTTISRPDVFSPSMDPIDYELHCGLQLQRAGWKTKSTPRTGDQGADVLAERNGKTLVVQCKLYSGSVGNGAVQEVVAARVFHKTDLAAVVSNAPFTRAARDLAGMSNVALLHHEQLASYKG